MEFPFIKIIELIRAMLLAENIHGNAIKSLCNYTWSAISSMSASMKEWARTQNWFKSQSFNNSQFVTWRFLSKSKFSIYKAYRSMTTWLIRRMLTPDDEILVCMDWTDICAFKVLAISLVIRGVGRTLPLYIKVIKKDMAENEMTNIEKDLLGKLFLGLEIQTRRRTIVTADRGFAKVELFKLIADYQAIFIIRLPRWAYVNIQGRWIHLATLPVTSMEGCVYQGCIYTKEHKYKVDIITRKVEQEKVNKEEDNKWILVTNGGFGIGTCTRYSRRMRIEEMFKDLKSSGFDVEKTSCKDEDTMDKLMIILSLAYNTLISWYLTHIPDSFRELITRRHKKKKLNELSVFTMAHISYDLVSRIRGFSVLELQYALKFLVIRSKNRKKPEIVEQLKSLVTKQGETSCNILS